MNDNINRLEKIAVALKELKDEVIFIGGSCSQFYVDDPELFDFRPTLDVDLIVQVYTYSEYDKLSKKLTSLGFLHDTTD